MLGAGVDLFQNSSRGSYFSLSHTTLLVLSKIWGGGFSPLSPHLSTPLYGFSYHIVENNYFTKYFIMEEQLGWVKFLSSENTLYKAVRYNQEYIRRRRREYLTA